MQQLGPPQGLEILAIPLPDGGGIIEHRRSGKLTPAPRDKHRNEDYTGRLRGLDDGRENGKDGLLWKLQGCLILLTVSKCSIIIKHDTKNKQTNKQNGSLELIN